MDGYYSIVDAAKLAGVTRRQLDYWVSVELIEPAITAPRGKAGKVKLFNFDNLFQLRILKALLDAGVSIQALRKLTDSDEDKDCVVHSSDVPGDTPVKVNMSGMIEAYENGEFNDLVVLVGDGVAKINLKSIYEEVKKDHHEWLSYKQIELFPEDVRPRQEKASSLKAIGVPRFEPGKVKKKKQA